MVEQSIYSFFLRITLFLLISFFSNHSFADYKGLKKISKNNSFMDDKGIPYASDLITDKGLKGMLDINSDKDTLPSNKGLAGKDNSVI